MIMLIKMTTMSMIMLMATSVHCQAIVEEMPSPCVLVEMGSGNSEKTRMFIDALLTKQSTLTYYPIDISEGKILCVLRID